MSRFRDLCQRITAWCAERDLTCDHGSHWPGDVRAAETARTRDDESGSDD